MIVPKSDAMKYAPVLRRMVELLGAEGNERLRFDEAMKRASTELKLEVPEHMVEPLLIVAFKVIGGGRIPGAPDA
jgi:hypothetical protein